MVYSHSTDIADGCSLFDLGATGAGERGEGTEDWDGSA